MSTKDVQPGPVLDIRFEDIEIGIVEEAGPITVTEREIIEFAKRYDPLPMHIDHMGGHVSAHKSLIASGVLTIALKQRLIMSISRNISIIGAARIEDQVFVRPVRTGDELLLKQTCIGKRESRSRNDRGLVSWDFLITNQNGEKVFTSRDIVMIRRRPEENSASPGSNLVPA